MRFNGKHDKSLPDPATVLQTVLEIVGEEAENAEPTEADDRWAREVRLNMQSRIAALRRQLTPVQPMIRRAPPISDEIRSLDRAGLLARLEVLRQGPDVRYAHQDLTGLSEDDLRHMLAILVAPTEG